MPIGQFKFSLGYKLKNGKAGPHFIDSRVKLKINLHFWLLNRSLQACRGSYMTVIWLQMESYRLIFFWCKFYLPKHSFHFKHPSWNALFGESWYIPLHLNGFLSLSDATGRAVICLWTLFILLWLLISQQPPQNFLQTSANHDIDFTSQVKLLNKHVSSQLVQEFRTILENDMQKEEAVQSMVKLTHNTQNPMLRSDIKANTKTFLL